MSSSGVVTRAQSETFATRNEPTIQIDSMTN